MLANILLQGFTWKAKNFRYSGKVLFLQEIKMIPGLKLIDHVPKKEFKKVCRGLQNICQATMLNVASQPISEQQRHRVS